MKTIYFNKERLIIFIVEGEGLTRFLHLSDIKMVASSCIEELTFIDIKTGKQLEFFKESEVDEKWEIGSGFTYLGDLLNWQIATNNQTNYSRCELVEELEDVGNSMCLPIIWNYNANLYIYYVDDFRMIFSPYESIIPTIDEVLGAGNTTGKSLLFVDIVPDSTYLKIGDTGINSIEVVSDGDGNLVLNSYSRDILQLEYVLNTGIINMYDGNEDLSIQLDIEKGEISAKRYLTLT